MVTEFHIFPSEEDCVFTVKQTGADGSRIFPSLVAATRHLRDYTKERGGVVVIHNADGHPANRIPLPAGAAV